MGIKFGELETLQEIDMLPAGRKIDRLILTKVMDAPRSGACPAFSEDMRDAWSIVERLRKTYCFSLTEFWDESPPVWSVTFDNEDISYEEGSATALTPPLAICRAALKVWAVDPMFYEGL